MTDSGTKYFGGHSDALTGTLSVKTKEDWLSLCASLCCFTLAGLKPLTVRHSALRSWHARTYTGSNIGSLDAWLLLRSLRTLSLRVARQSATATSLAQWLAALSRADTGTDLDGPGGVVEHVWHTSLQADARELLGEGRQMTSGPACFAILLRKAQFATHLPHKLKFFVVRRSRASL